jgi:hypothetical protein
LNPLGPLIREIVSRLFNHLYSHEVVILCIVFAVIVLVWRYESKESRREKAAFRRRLVWPASILFISVFLLSLIRFCKPGPDPFPPNVLGILVLRLEGDPQGETQKRISRMLNEELSRTKFGPGLVVKAAKESNSEDAGLEQAHEQARRIGDKYNASIVIWGTRIGDSEFHPRVTIVRPSIPKAGKNYTLDPVNVAVPAGLIAQPLSVIDLLVGYNDYGKGNYVVALEHFEAVLQRDALQENDLTDVRIYAGNCHFEIGQNADNKAANLQKAIGYYQKALESSKTKPPSQTWG